MSTLTGIRRTYTGNDEPPDAAGEVMVQVLGPAVVVITGVMAAGKSAVAQVLAARFPKGVHVKGDAFRRMIVSGRQELTPEMATEAVAQLWLRYSLSAYVADEYASHGFTTIVQDVLLGADLIGYLRLVRTRPLYLVVLAPAVGVVVARERDREKTGYGLWTIEGLDHSLRAETPRIGLWLDNSRLTVTQTVDAIMTRLGSAELDDVDAAVARAR